MQLPKTVEEFCRRSALQAPAIAKVSEHFLSVDALAEWVQTPGKDRRKFPGIGPMVTAEIERAAEQQGLYKMDTPETLGISHEEYYAAEAGAPAEDLEGLSPDMTEGPNKAAPPLAKSQQGGYRRVGREEAREVLNNTIGTSYDHAPPPDWAMSWPNLSRLDDPFPAEDVEWKPVTIKKANRRGLFAPYITSRAVQERLDEVCGKFGWQNKFEKGPDGGVLCGIGILIGGIWVWKYDGASNSDIEPVKGGLSNAMRRAGVTLGIGRYLYKAEPQWLAVDDRGRPLQRPVLPLHMLPDGKPPVKWANEAELISSKQEEEDNRADTRRTFDNRPNASRDAHSAKKQSAQQPAQTAQRGGAPKPLAALVQPPDGMRAGDYPAFAPGAENWDWAMPQNARRKNTAKVTEADLKKFQEHYQQLGWTTGAIMLVISQVFKQARFSALCYAEFCGLWAISSYATAYERFMTQDEAARAARDAERGQPAPEPDDYGGYY